MLTEPFGARFDVLLSAEMMFVVPHSRLSSAVVLIPVCLVSGTAVGGARVTGTGGILRHRV